MHERPKTIDQIDTPAVLIDFDRASANIARAQTYADRQNVKLRPHIKTHKLPFWAKKQVEAGAIGITCQKIGEAEVMADAGLDDIFLPYNIIGQTKLARLKRLHQRIKLSVSVDNQVALAGLAKTFGQSDHPLTVLIECDTGMGRCGVQSHSEAAGLARAISDSAGLRFGGLMTYPAAGQSEEAEIWLAGAKDAVLRAGLPCDIVTSGGTPDLWRLASTGTINEYRPGTYIYLDRFQVAKGAGTKDDCALTVLSTVVSCPGGGRAVLDAGSKALTSDLLGMADYGELVGIDGAYVTALSEEHGHVTLAGAKLSVGDRVRVLPNHACVVSNLFDEVYLVSGDRVLDVLPVAARGKVC